MRTCQSCGKENPDDQDFCSCGEYLRWEPTGFVQAITPEMAKQARAEAAAPPVEPQARPAPPPPPEAGNGHAVTAPPARATAPVKAAPQAPAPIPAVPKTLVQGAVPSPPAAAPETATIVLRLREGDPAKGETLHQAVEPGQRSQVLAMVRNQSGIVDNYDLRIEGLPDDWWSIYPATVYLVPFGSGGTYEQEVEIHLHPPHGPEAEARAWELKVVAHSKAHGVDTASAPLALHIAPYIETATALRPQRRKGRRKADFDVSVTNRANAPVLVALEGSDPDGELRFGFNRPPQEIPPGATVKSEMRVRPPKQIWIGRGQERRLEVVTVTGEEAAARAAAEPLAAAVLLAEAGTVRKGLFRRRAPQVPGVYGPRVYKPQIHPPDANIGPGGISIRKPQFRGPQVQGPQLGSVNASQLAKGLKLPSHGGAATPQAPLLPTQGVFRQKPWIPWWAVPLALLLVLLLLLLYKLFPQDVAVPNLVGQKSSFEAEKALTTAKLKLDPSQRQKVDDKAAPGSVIGQTPAPGAKVKKDSAVTVLVAVGSGKVNVPNIVGQTAGDAEKSLRAKNLTLGQASPQPVDPNGKISSQIPAAGEVVKAGTPVSIFYPDPAAAAAKKKDKKNGGAGAAAAGAAGATGGGAKDIVVPAIAAAKLDAYAKKAADLGIVPQVKKQFADAPPGTLFATDPPGGTKVANGAKLNLLVSAGQPQVVFTNGKDILRVNGANGAKFDPVAASPQSEADPTWSADGTHVAYTADNRVFLKDLTKKDAPSVPLSPAADKYENLAWAPTADVNLLAMDKDLGNGNTDLCLGVITKDPLAVQCFDEPGFSVIRSIHWAPDGRSLIGVGVKNPIGSGVFGIVLWKVKPGKPAFSPNRADWTGGHFVTDIGTPQKGVLDAAISPDGQQLALVSNQGSSFFRLWLAKKGDFLMTSAKPTPVRACKVTYRGDGQEVMVVQADAGCTEDVGALVRFDVKDSKSQRELNAAGDDPQFQPFNLGG
jgi:beta-lactam-binding protein with PASTA domain